MTELEDLFLRATPRYEAADDELRAVREGGKAIAWYPMTREQVEDYSDHDDLIALAGTMGLSVLTCPREVEAGLPAGAPVLDVFVLRRAEIWRVDAFRACRETLGRYQWSDSSEYLYSFFLGYSEKSCETWIAERRHNRLGWVGQTVYSLLQSPDVEKLEPGALKCFPPDFETASRTVFSHPDGFLLREDPERVLPADVFLCRFALDNVFFLRLIQEASGTDEDSVLSAQLGVGAEELNCQLASAIEIWWQGGWRTRLPLR
jgi:hypothetical protein